MVHENNVENHLVIKLKNYCNQIERAVVPRLKRIYKMIRDVVENSRWDNKRKKNKEETDFEVIKSKLERNNKAKETNRITVLTCGD